MYAFLNYSVIVKYNSGYESEVAILSADKSEIERGCTENLVGCWTQFKKNRVTLTAGYKRA